MEVAVIKSNRKTVAIQVNSDLSVTLRVPRQMNHSKAFWGEVEKVLPDYKAQVRWLKDEGGNIMRRNG